ncbi:MAG TPA: flagellin [Candidatus Acidoferrales bacterium]|nr:flagellin [Candidatus Acidoferrales bacterium]
MPFGILNNIPALQAEGALDSTQMSLNTTLQQLSTGMRINSGADDPAGLAIANGLSANIAALNQSVQNANDGVGNLQVADGALSQVTSLLNTAVTIATEASTGTVSSSQRDSLDAEYQQILQEINRIGTTTEYNGTSVFSAATTSIYLTDANANSTITSTVGALSDTTLALNGTSLAGVDGTGAQAALTAIDAAVQTVANDRGTIGASVNRLQDASAVMTTEVQNLTAAENNIMAADIPSAISQLSNLSVLSQTGMAALAQANSQQQSILKLLQ